MNNFRKRLSLLLCALLVLCLPLCGCEQNAAAKELVYDYDAKILAGGGCEILSNTCVVCSIGTFEGAELVIPTEHIPPRELQKIGLKGTFAVISIGDNAFKDCAQLTSVKLHDKILTIGDYAFENCSNLTDLKIPDSVTYIGTNAFAGCPDSLFTEHEQGLYIGNDNNPYHALVKVTAVDAETFDLHKDTKVIVGGAFAGCSQLTSITIPDGMTGLPEGLLADCAGLTEIRIPNGIDEMPEEFFSACGHLTRAALPEAQGLTYTLSEDGASYLVSGLGSCEQTFFSIPTLHEGLPVTAIADGAFVVDAEVYEQYSKDFRIWYRNAKSDGVSVEKTAQCFIEHCGTDGKYLGFTAEELDAMDRMSLLQIVAVPQSVTYDAEAAFGDGELLVVEGLG